MYRRLLLHLALLFGRVWCLMDEDKKKPTYLDAHVGDSVVFVCDLDFPQDVVVPFSLSWNKEGERVFTVSDGSVQSTEGNYEGRVAVVEAPSGKAAVNLTAVREPDRGWYECRVTFPNRSPNTRLNGTWFHLTVHERAETNDRGSTEAGPGLQKESVAAGSDLLEIPPINQTVMSGESARFQCTTKDPDAKVNWFKNGEPLGEDPHTSGSSEGTLTIPYTDMNDPGLYTCKVTSKTGEVQSVSAYLDVLYKAKVLLTPKEIFLPFGRPGLLECQTAANPPVTKIRWEKDGFLFDPYNVQGVFRRSNGSLYFNKIDEKHAGEYTCTPYNDLGTEGPSPPITVLVQRPPVFTLTPHKVYLQKVGDTIIIPCEAFEGDDTQHRPKIKWSKKDGTPLPDDRTSISGGNLTISDIKASDRGFYLCVASNDAATISADTEIKIEQNIFPRSPYNLSGNATQNSVDLQWNSGSSVTSQTHYVWYSATDSKYWRRLKVSGVKETVEGLDPGKEYEFLVSSQDFSGDSVMSKAFRIHTKGNPSGSDANTQELSSHQDPSKAIGPPRNLRIAMNLGGYTLYWDVPEFGNDLLEYYKVHWAPGPLEFAASDIRPTIAETKETSYYVGDLKEDSTYHFQVKAIAVNDYHAASDTFVLHIPSYRKGQAFPLFLAAGIGVLIAVSVMCVYSNRLYVRTRIRNLRSSRH